MMSKLKLYYDVMSQPSRTLGIFLLTNKIPFEPKEVRLGKGEHLTEEFGKINPLKLVPVIQDGDFTLRESVAILRYLCREKNVPDHWYPKDSKAQAKVDEYVEWQHLGTRINCGLYFRKMWLEPMMTKEPPSPKLEKMLKRNMVEACDAVQDKWLGDKKFICGDQITIADLLAATELEQPKLCGYDPREGRPALTAWLKRVQDATNPHYDKMHYQLNRIAEKFGGVPPVFAGSKPKL